MVALWCEATRTRILFAEAATTTTATATPTIHAGPIPEEEEVVPHIELQIQIPKTIAWLAIFAINRDTLRMLVQLETSDWLAGRLIDSVELPFPSRISFRFDRKKKQ